LPIWLQPLLLAPFIGSFLGVLIRRLPAGRDVVASRSACDNCRHPLGARDLLPLVSYLVLRGRCRHCGAAIGCFHPAVELAAISVAAIAAVAIDDDAPLLWAACTLGWCLLALAWIDACHLRLPDVLTLPLLLAGLAVTAWIDPDAIAAHALGAAIGYLSLAGLAAAYRRLRGRDGLGTGDAKLLAAAGAWLGWQPLPWVVLLAAALGLAMAGVSHLRGRRISRATALPFGPCLAIAIFTFFLYLA
jgi:leader peptidase (prepilin peptidase)/N-methyltransferase